MKSEFKQINRDVLLEWVYDSSNIVLESYKIMSNSKDLVKSYIAGDSSITNNTLNNQLFNIDAFSNKYIKVDTSKYSFLSISDYTSSGIQHDKIKIYFPANYTFGEYQGVYLRLYTFDYLNKNTYEISNFYFDVNENTGLLQNSISPILYQTRIWDKFIELNIPSVHALSLQRDASSASSGSINYYLTNGLGLSKTAPIFIDFRFITKVSQIGSFKTYLTNQKSIFQISQTPQLELLDLYLEESIVGDYFEVYPTYNGTFEEFVSYMDDSYTLGKNYYLEFNITIFEENIKGKTLTYKVEKDFTEIVEYRPILKYSTTTAVIDVEMKLINGSDGNVIIKKASYGMKPDQLSKYLINSKKINIRGAVKPKIYSKNQFNMYNISQLGKYPIIETEVSVLTPVLLPVVNKIVKIKYGSSEKSISAFSKQSLNKVAYINIDNYHFMGRLKIGIKPFDNIFKFILALKYINNSSASLEPLDLTNCQDIKLVFKGDNKTIEFTQYFTNEVVAKFGMCQFKITEDKFHELKELNNMRSTVFYITTTNQGIRNVLYTGIYTILDNIGALVGNNGNGNGNSNITVSDLLKNGSLSDSTNNNNLSNLSNQSPDIIFDPNQKQETAIVTRRQVPSVVSNSNVKNATNMILNPNQYGVKKT